MARALPARRAVVGMVRVEPPTVVKTRPVAAVNAAVLTGSKGAGAGAAVHGFRRHREARTQRTKP